jgi:hypothetical protein
MNLYALAIEENNGGKVILRSENREREVVTF